METNNLIYCWHYLKTLLVKLVLQHTATSLLNPRHFIQVITDFEISDTVTPVHAVTSIQQPPVLKGHIVCPVIENFI